ncbi:flavin mononucleotide hydrolase 1, chloroplatic [Oryza glaberrima]|nr:flavin mononucleotide hydrolase 1, chloroplatic [Oryza glaberrima]
MVSLLPRAPCLASSIPKPTALRPPCMASTSATAPAAAAATAEASASRPPRKLPVLLFDVMDTVVRDPFYHHIPAFFQMSMKELLESKHPTAWSEFEMGLIDENELAKKFFNDGRSFDLEGLKACMVRAYEYIDGVEDILYSLKQNNYEVHAFTNYPVWYQLVEEKLKLSKYLSWTFCSCTVGKRKPSPDFYLHAVDHLNVDPASCIFIDDRMTNIEAALSVGMVGLQFKNAEVLKKDLCSLGVEFAPVHEGEIQVQ